MQTQIDKPLPLAWMSSAGISDVDINLIQQSGHTKGWLRAAGVPESEIQWLNSIAYSENHLLQHRPVKRRLNQIYKTALSFINSLDEIVVCPAQ